MNKKNPVNSTAIEKENTEDGVSETLPSNWLSVPLGNVAQYINGRAFKPHEWETKGFPIIRIQNLTKSSDVINYSSQKHEPKYLVNKGDVLMAWSATLDVFVWKEGPSWLNQHIFNVKEFSSVINKYFLFFALKRAISEFYSKTHGTGMVHVTKPIFEAHEIPLPPLNEQKRIVAKLDAIIPRIESVKNRLEKIPLILKRFRQSVLSAAVTGKLTEKWREDNPDVERAETLLERIRIEREERYKKECKEAENIGERKPKKIHSFNQSEVTVSFECPSTWINTYLGNFIYDFCYGTSNKADYNKKGTPVVRIPNIISKYIDVDDLKFLDDIETNKNNLVKENDILIIRSNGSKDLVGKNCIVPKLSKIYAFASYLIRIRPTFLSAEFVHILLNSPVIKEQFFSQAKSSAGINNINTEELASVELALPPLEEQKEIVCQVDKLFALADKVEAHYNKAKARVDKLSQSVLAKAFRGELVPQDPNDEPAEKLLERILAEKARMTAELNIAKKPGTKTSIKKVSRTKK